jgi:hypothetical protein
MKRLPILLLATWFTAVQGQTLNVTTTVRVGTVTQKPPGGGAASCNNLVQTFEPTLNSAFGNISYKWLATDFVASADYTLCKAELRLIRTGSPSGTMTAQIHASSAGPVPGAAVGTASDSVAVGTVGTSFSYITFTNMSASLVNGTAYFMVLKFTANGTAGNVIEWAYGDDAARECDFSDNSGSSWDEYADVQLWFKTYSN